MEYETYRRTASVNELLARDWRTITKLYPKYTKSQKEGISLLLSNYVNHETCEIRSIARSIPRPLRG